MSLTTSFIATEERIFCCNSTKRQSVSIRGAAKSRGVAPRESESGYGVREGTFYCRRVSIKVQYKRTGRAREREKERKGESELSG